MCTAVGSNLQKCFLLFTRVFLVMHTAYGIVAFRSPCTLFWLAGHIQPGKTFENSVYSAPCAKSAMKSGVGSEAELYAIAIEYETRRIRNSELQLCNVLIYFYFFFFISNLAFRVNAHRAPAIVLKLQLE